jgi:RHS repeat-associated protein
MYVANTHLKPVIGIDIHFVNMPFPFIPLPHPYIGLVIDPFDYIPFIGATVKVNNVPRGNTDTMGMIITFVHIPFGAGFTIFPIIGHDSQNFFGSKTVSVDGAPMSGAGYMLMTCNDIGLPLSFRPGKKFIPIPSLYLPTSFCIPLQWGKPVMVGGPLVPNFSLMALLKAFAFGSFLKIFGKLGGKMLKKLNNKVAKKFPSTQKLSNRLCKMGFEPVDLITGRVNYEYTDFELPGPIPITWTRNWDSDSAIQGPLGHGVQHCYDRCIQQWNEEGCLSVTLDDGRQAVFPLLYYGESYYHHQEKMVLSRKQNGHFLLEDYSESLNFHFNYETQPGTWNLSLIENYNGDRIQFHYVSKHLRAITDSVGRQLLLQLDKQHRITTIIVKHREQEQTLVNYGYNDNNDLVEIKDALGQVTSIVYRYHLMTQKTDRNGQNFYWEYDSKRRCIHTWGDGGVLEGFIQYDKGSNVVINSLGETTTYYFNEDNLCIQETDHYGNSKYIAYTDSYDVFRETDEAGNITGYAYDELSRLKEKTFPDGNSLQFHYNDHNQPTLIINPDGTSQTFGYDARRRLNFINYPNKKTTTYEYNTNGQLEAIIETGNQITTFDYDEDENVTSAHLPDATVVHWKYDVWGRCTQSTNTAGQVRTLEYDALNRLRRMLLPDGNTIKLEYDAYDEVTHATDKYNDVQLEYTALGSVKKCRRHNSELNFLYDTEDRLRTIINESGSHYNFGYNKRGEVISETGFDGIQQRYQRDAIGRITQAIRPDNRYTQYEYDANGRIVRINYHDGSWKTFTYDKNGQLTGAENEDCTIKIERDRTGNVISEKQGAYEIKSVYDKFLNRVHITSNLGADIELKRNKLGQVTNMQADYYAQMITGEPAVATNWNAQISYDQAGLELERLLPGGLASTWQFDNAGRPEEHKVNRKGVAQSWKKYTWNINDRLTNVLDALSQSSTRFKHDALGNLAFAQYADKSVVHRATDPIGNIYETKRKTDRKYNTSGALLESDKYSYEYDAEGNLISKTAKGVVSGDGIKKTTYEWYANGLLKKVTRPDGKQAEYTYDALDRRMAKYFGGHITRWVWDGHVPLHEWSYKEKEEPNAEVNEWGEIVYNKAEPNPQNSATCTKNITWVFEDNGFVPCAKIENGNTYSIISNYQGTPTEAYDEDGKKVWECVLDIYGRSRSIQGKKDFIPFRYQGQYEDEETGLYYNRCRYYAPDEGVYISQDPIGLAGNNPTFYGYVNDTTTEIDPFGLSGIGSFNEFQQVFKGTFTKANQMPWNSPNLTKDAAEGWKWYQSTNLSKDTPVIGALKHTKKYAGTPGYNVLKSDRWSPGVNKAWVQGGIDSKKTFKIVSPQTKPYLWDKKNKRPRVFDDELKQLRRAGYVEINNHMVHPDNVGKFKKAAHCK